VTLPAQRNSAGNPGTQTQP
jgi:hypothetical protein